MERTRSFDTGVLSAICSNLKKGCEKQLRPEDAALFSQLADYYEKMTEPVSSASLSDLLPMIAQDIDSTYLEVEKAAKAVEDRGSLRCMTWGKKVTAIHKSILARYEKQGDALLAENRLYVCEACGFIAIAAQVPELCPICKAPSSRFVTVS